MAIVGDLLEVDEVIVSKAEWGKVKSGDQEAIKKMRLKLKDMRLYVHMLVFETDEEQEVVTLRDLNEHAVVSSVVITGVYDEWVTVSMGVDQ